MKIVVLVICCFLGVSAFAQETASTTEVKTQSMRILSEDGTTYTASNGTVYKKGGKITFISGSGGNDTFKHTNLLVLKMPMSDRYLTYEAAGQEFEILEFKQEKSSAKRVYAVIADGDKWKYAVFLEGAIASKEIK